jgi:8-oxo-dGTP pyrophosphatase MutT (NUDIX family)
MNKELAIHKIQASILRELVFRSRARFAELNIAETPSDQFSFHIKTLLETGLIEKDDENLYELTAKGKEFANRFDTDSLNTTVERQAKIGVLVGAVREEKSARHYLIQQRLKEPYFGFYGLITGKIRWGETVIEAASRELNEEAGFRGDPMFLGVKHKMDYRGDALLEDKYFYIVRFDHCIGDLQIDFPGGRNAWLTRKEILKLPDLFDGVEESLEMLDQDAPRFIERAYRVRRY